VLKFENIPHKNPRSKKKTWRVQENVLGKDIIVGRIVWWEPIKQYIFEMNALDTIALDEQDLKQITDFVEKQNG